MKPLPSKVAALLKVAGFRPVKMGAAVQRGLTFKPAKGTIIPDAYWFAMGIPVPVKEYRFSDARKWRV